MMGFIVVLSVLLAVPEAWAGHPLVTDDTGTQGKGAVQFEMNGEFGTDKTGDTRSEEIGAQAILSVGLSRDLDAVIGLPYQYWRTRGPQAVASDAGLSDVGVELKWRFLESGPLSFALKPSLTLPTGDSGRGLGGGEPTYGMFLIASREIGAWGLHANAGYIRNQNAVGEELNHWHASLAVTAPIGKRVQAVANAAFNHNHAHEETAPLSAVIGGFIVNLTDGLDLDLGLKIGTSRPETDYAVLSGIAWRI